MRDVSSEVKMSEMSDSKQRAPPNISCHISHITHHISHLPERVEEHSKINGHRIKEQPEESDDKPQMDGHRESSPKANAIAFPPDERGTFPIPKLIP